MSPKGHAAEEICRAILPIVKDKGTLPPHIHTVCMAFCPASLKPTVSLHLPCRSVFKRLLFQSCNIWRILKTPLLGRRNSSMAECLSGKLKTLGLTPQDNNSNSQT